VPLALLLASHPLPSVTVTALTALLAAGAGHGLASGTLVTAAVAAGQLSIGWSNDLIDASRDRQVGRVDKPVARGEVREGIVRAATVAAVTLCVGLSLACGLASAAVHLLLGVSSGWAYNLVLKRTVWSAVPYAVAFGCLPAVVTLALPRPEVPAAWTIAAGVLLGVGAHLLNALPDLGDDQSTGVRGLPHRLGSARSGCSLRSCCSPGRWSPSSVRVTPARPGRGRSSGCAACWRSSPWWRAAGSRSWQRSASPWSSCSA
jgi:4-hydroxybenzoate polyprenyltransferase